jgi:hypothetical protein
MGGIDLSLQVVLDSSNYRKVSSTDFNGLGVPRCLTWMFGDKILRTDDDDVEAITVESSMTVLSLPDMREHCGFYEFFQDATGSPWRGDVYTIQKGAILYWLTKLYVDILNGSRRGGPAPWVDYAGRMSHVKEWLETTVIWPHLSKGKDGCYSVPDDIFNPQLPECSRVRFRNARWEDNGGYLKWQWQLSV